MSTKKIRCSFCRKKTGLINFTCKCKGVFCSKHRYTHTHLCKGVEKKKEESKIKQHARHRAFEEELRLKEEEEQRLKEEEEQRLKEEEEQKLKEEEEQKLREEEEQKE